MKQLWLLAGAMLFACNVAVISAADDTEQPAIPVQLPIEKESGPLLPMKDVAAKPAAGDKKADAKAAPKAVKVPAADLGKRIDLKKDLDKPAVVKGTDKAQPAAEPAPKAVPVLTKDEALIIIPPLQESAFTIGGVHSGDSEETVRALYGRPDSRSVTDHYTTLQYDGTDKKVRVMLRNEMPDVLTQEGIIGKAVPAGVEDIYVSKSGELLQTGLNIRLDNTEEVLLRQYGRPDNILRDANANVYYFVYVRPNKKEMIVFAVHERKVERIALMPCRAPYVTADMAVPQKPGLSERDFTLMGYGVDTTFEANKYNMWERFIPKDDRKFWLYGDYGLEVDKQSKVQRVFILTNNSYTSRGITLGHHVSSLLSVYGMPDRIERGPEGLQYVDAFYYDSPWQKGVSLAFIIKHNGHFIDDIILTARPIKDLQNPKKRYGLE